MSLVKIRWLSDYCECETCGVSYAEGAHVSIDGAMALELTPTAHCFDGLNWDPEEVFRLIFEKMGHSLETETTISQGSVNREAHRLSIEKRQK